MSRKFRKEIAYELLGITLLETELRVYYWSLPGLKNWHSTTNIAN